MQEKRLLSQLVFCPMLSVMFQYLLRLIFGSKHERDINTILPLIQEISAFESKVQDLSNEELSQQTDRFKKELSEGKSLDDILPEAFSTVREAAWRALGMRHFDVQMIGGMVLHQGKIAEMKTGEGKTLTATTAVYLNSLLSKGVHLVTVNDYLAARDAAWMKPVYDLLGISVGVIQHDMSSLQRREAYRRDVTYGTNSEFGFDYLRDNMVTEKEQKVQRDFFFAIVDEVDSILIDEARTPLIISGPTEENTEQYRNIDIAIRRLVEEEEKAPDPEPLEFLPGKEEPHLIRKYYYDIDEKAHSVFLTEQGINLLEEILGIENLFAPNHSELIAHCNQALKSHLIYKDGIDYVVQDGQVVIVDEHTGRTMPGRRYSDGLHQALEAKERLEVKQESQTLASITYQNFFRMYEKLSGMTGTADTEAEEFKKIYQLDIVVIPTNVPVIRKDYPDRVYRTQKEKYDSIVQEIQDCSKRGQPVLVGTIAVETSEHLAQLLKKAKVSHSVLNARQHDREAQIIADAGKAGSVTVATNMAGRGTDIVLGGTPQYLAEIDNLVANSPSTEKFKDLLLKKKFSEAQDILQDIEGKIKQKYVDIYDRSQIWLNEHKIVKEAGGLHILGTERHESRRIDNQLRGRSGRQGDEGSSRFYLSLEDHLMRLFGGEKIKNLMGRLGMDEGQELEAGMVNRAIARAQKRVESHNFDIRKHLLEYDEVMNRQREFVYKERDFFLNGENFRPKIMSWTDEVIEMKILHFCEGNDTLQWDLHSLNEWLTSVLTLSRSFSPEDLRQSKNPQLLLFESIQQEAQKQYHSKMEEVGESASTYVEKRIALDVIDSRWKENLHQIDILREGVWASGYAERSPLVEFKLEGFRLFDNTVSLIKEQIVDHLFRAKIEARLQSEDTEDEEYSFEEEASEYTMKRSKGSTVSSENTAFFSSNPQGVFSNKGIANERNPTEKKAPSYAVSGGGASRRRASRRRKKH